MNSLLTNSTLAIQLYTRFYALQMHTPERLCIVFDGQ